MPNVTITPPAVVKVQVGSKTNPQSTVINYGAQANKLRNLSDVDASNLQDGYSVVYIAATDQFTVSPVSIDGGTY